MLNLVPSPFCDIIVRKSPTLATYRWLPTKTAVEAVEPSSDKYLFQNAKNQYQSAYTIHLQV